MGMVSKWAAAERHEFGTPLDALGVEKVVTGSLRASKAE
jgi:hypothetical protein